jgi:hypothetical protein
MLALPYSRKKAKIVVQRELGMLANANRKQALEPSSGCITETLDLPDVILQ